MEIAWRLSGILSSWKEDIADITTGMVGSKLQTRGSRDVRFYLLPVTEGCLVLANVMMSSAWEFGG
jgi:hypothetical protein